ncbi:MFS transporter [Paenibacillus sp. CC-CFT747]|nr:MFS transporter [Paenibacillus sp. CC-CFT747]
MRKKLTTFYHNYDTAIWIRVIGTILTSLTNFMVRPFLVLYLYDKLNSSLLLPMIIIGLQPLCGLLVNLFAGNISDRFGRKPVLIVSLLIQTVTLSGYIFAESVWEYAVISILNGIGAALFMPAANAQIADVVPENKRAEVFALLHTALNVGSAGGPLIGVVLFAWSSQIVFLICALSVLAYLILVWIKVPETLPASSRSAAPETGRAKAAFRHGEHKAIYTLTVLALPVSLLYAQVESTLPLHLQTHFLDFKTVYAAMLTFNGLTVILLQLWLAKRTEGLPLSCGRGCLRNVLSRRPWLRLLPLRDSSVRRRVPVHHR